jgi:hypothetical protein
VLDQFLLSGIIFESLVECAYAVHDMDNMSDHDPIFVRLFVDIRFAGFNERSYLSRISWPNSTEFHIHDYRYALSRKSQDITLPVDALVCHDLRFSQVAHWALHDYLQSIIINAHMTAATMTIIRTCNRPDSGRLPGWSEHVRPLRERSMFWHHMWIDCRHPMTAIVADSMRRTRAAYQYALRKIKKDEEYIVRERRADASFHNSNSLSDFWTEIRRLRGL